VRTALLPSWRRWLLCHLPEPLLREPFALWLAFVCVLTAGLQFAGLGEPSSVSRLLPAWIIKAWNAEMLVGGLLTMFGILRSKPRVLILGLQPLGLAALAYSVALLHVAGLRGLFPALITIAFAGACFVKSFVYSTARLRLP
jgi:hypothetical protein